MAKKTVFLHVPKCGGTSLRSWIINKANPGMVCPEQFNLGRWDQEQLNKFSVFSGHFKYDKLSLIHGEKTVITMLREPQARLLSMYYFGRSHNWPYIEKAAPEFRPMKELRLQPFLEQYGERWGNEATLFIGSGDVWLALDRLHQFQAVGVLEDLEPSLRWFSKVLGRPFVPMPRENVTGGRTEEPAFEADPPVREELTPVITELLRRHTQSDQLLFREAKCLLYAYRAEQVGVLQAEIDALRQSNSWRITAPLRQIADQLRVSPIRARRLSQKAR